MILSGLVIALAHLSVASATQAPIRICADPDNLPYTSSNSQRPGFYLDLAAILATRLDRQIDYYWWSSLRGGRSVRLTLKAGKCDLYFGLPYRNSEKGPGLRLTKPILQMGYALVAATGSPIQQLDELHGKRVGVLFSSPPQHVLAAQSEIEAVTFRYPHEAMDALRAGEIDAAFVWGPTAGYINKYQLDNQYTVTPIDGTDLQWRVAIGLRRNETVLKEQLDHQLSQLGDTIAQLADDYGFPSSQPQRLAANPASQPKTTKSANNKAAPTDQNPLPSTPQTLAAGQALFNQYCARCHGRNAVNGERRTNLQALNKRYPKTSDAVFYKTVTEGRPKKGMPPMGRALTAGRIWQIKTFLDTVQAP